MGIFTCTLILWILLIDHVHENKNNEMFGYSTPVILATPNAFFEEIVLIKFI